MCEATFKPVWNVRVDNQEMRIISLALLGRLKPDTPDARAADVLLKNLTNQRLRRVNELSEQLERWSADGYEEPEAD